MVARVNDILPFTSTNGRSADGRGLASKMSPNGSASTKFDEMNDGITVEWWVSEYRKEAIAEVDNLLNDLTNFRAMLSDMPPSTRFSEVQKIYDAWHQLCERPALTGCGEALEGRVDASSGGRRGPHPHRRFGCALEVMLDALVELPELQDDLPDTSGEFGFSIDE